MKSRDLILILFPSIILTGCLFDSDSDTITGDYETGWIDIPQTRSINKGEGLVPAYVSAIGHNAAYIIAKQHPIEYGNIVSVHTDTTNYYIIKISTSSYQDEPVYGPLGLRSFDSLRRRLNITAIKFDMLYPEH